MPRNSLIKLVCLSGYIMVGLFALFDFLLHVCFCFRSRNQDEMGGMIVEVVSLCTILKVLE